MLRPCPTLAIAALVVFAGSVRAVSFGRSPTAEYQFEVVLCQGDPNGSVEAGTIQVLKPSLALVSGTEFWCFKSDQIKVGKQTVDVVRVVTVIATDLGDGAIKAKVILEKHQTFGEDDAAQKTTTSTKKAKTIQSGAKFRVELGRNAKDMYWVEVTIREAKK
jgi:hypothetical protein